MSSSSSTTITKTGTVPERKLTPEAREAQNHVLLLFRSSLAFGPSPFTKTDLMKILEPAAKDLDQNCKPDSVFQNFITSRFLVSSHHKSGSTTDDANPDQQLLEFNKPRVDGVLDHFGDCGLLLEERFSGENIEKKILRRLPPSGSAGKEKMRRQIVSGSSEISKQNFNTTFDKMAKDGSIFVLPKTNGGDSYVFMTAALSPSLDMKKLEEIRKAKNFESTSQARDGKQQQKTETSTITSKNNNNVSEENEKSAEATIDMQSIHRFISSKMKLEEEMEKGTFLQHILIRPNGFTLEQSRHILKQLLSEGIVSEQRYKLSNTAKIKLMKSFDHHAGTSSSSAPVSQDAATATNTNNNNPKNLSVIATKDESRVRHHLLKNIRAGSQPKTMLLANTAREEHVTLPFVREVFAKLVEDRIVSENEGQNSTTRFVRLVLKTINREKFLLLLTTSLSGRQLPKMNLIKYLANENPNWDREEIKLALRDLINEKVVLEEVSRNDEVLISIVGSTAPPLPPPQQQQHQHSHSSSSRNRQEENSSLLLSSGQARRTLLDRAFRNTRLGRDLRSDEINFLVEFQFQLETHRDASRCSDSGLGNQKEIPLRSVSVKFDELRLFMNSQERNDIFDYLLRRNCLRKSENNYDTVRLGADLHNQLSDALVALNERRRSRSREDTTRSSSHHQKHQHQQPSVHRLSASTSTISQSLPQQPQQQQQQPLVPQYQSISTNLQQQSLQTLAPPPPSSINNTNSNNSTNQNSTNANVENLQQRIQLLQQQLQLQQQLHQIQQKMTQQQQQQQPPQPQPQIVTNVVPSPSSLLPSPISFPPPMFIKDGNFYLRSNPERLLLARPPMLFGRY